MIIKPQSKPIRRISIELDASGQAQIATENILTGKPLPLTEVIVHLLQIATSLAAGALSSKPQIISEGDNGAEKKSH